jgi:hypothetical protein
VDPAAVVAADVNVSLDNEFRQHDGVLPIFRRLPNSECSSSQSSTVAWAGVDSSHGQVPQTNTRYHIKESSFGGVTKMIRADYRNGPGYQGHPQLKGDGAGKAGRGHDISKDPRVRKQVEWQTFKQVCGWAAVNTVLEELVTCHCAGAPLRLGASTQTQVHVIYRYSCHFAHSMTCPWVCRVVVPHAGNTDNTVQKVNISERSAVHQNHTCLIQISTQAHGSHGLKQDFSWRTKMCGMGNEIGGYTCFHVFIKTF